MTTSRRLVRLIAGQRFWILAGAFLGFLAIGANVALMAVSAFLIAKAALVTNVADVAIAITLVRVLAISRAAFRYLERYATHVGTLRILADLRVWFFASIEPLAPARLATVHGGDLLTRIVADVDTLEDFYVRVLAPPLVAVLIAIGAGLLLGAFAPILGLALLIFLVLAGVVIPLVSRRRSRAPAAAMAGLRGQLGARIVDEINGLGELIALDAGRVHRRATLALAAELDRGQSRLAVTRGATAALTAILAGLAAVTILGLAIPLVSGGQIEGVNLALLPLVAIASFEAVQPLAQAAQLSDATSAAAGRLFELIDPSPATTNPSAPAVIAAGPLDLAIRGLRFRYGPDRPLVLDGLDLEVPAGTVVGLVGPSGAGKSTIVNVLLRFWDYDTGTISIGGRDLHDYDADDVRRVLGVVAQDVHLFNATLRDNLALADADVSDERVVEACEMAQLGDFLAGLPQGIRTPIGENGVLLSGGERQRLAIARLIVKDAPIVILDEPTANLDLETERRLLDALRPFLAGRAALIVTHRPQVLSFVDRVVRLADGQAGPLA